MKPLKPLKPQPITKAQRDLWFELNTIIRECGAWTVTQPDVFPIRFECPMDSQAPVYLAEFGSVRHIGTHERLMPVTETLKEHGRNTTVTRQHVAPIVVSVFEFRLPVG